jgi:nitroreductase
MPDGRVSYRRQNKIKEGDNMFADVITPEVQTERKVNYSIAPLLVDRWSPRSMTGEPLADDDLFPLFEGARWAPSSYNSQLWRFIIARRQNQEEFERFFSLLTPGNQVWTKNAGALVVVASRPRIEYSDKLLPAASIDGPSITHSFDAGAAWENLALEATRRELVAHAMHGFDYERAKTELSIPSDSDVNAMIAIGRRAPAETLPDKYRAMERPSERRPLHEIVFEGAFGRQIPGLP